jgi:hypothetical protein
VTDLNGASERNRISDAQIRSSSLNVESSQLLCKPSRNPPIIDQYVSSEVANQELRVSMDFAESTNAVRVREPSAPSQGYRWSEDQLKPLAHPRNQLLIQLNDNWRIVEDHRQWILQRRKGNARNKNSGWRDRSFCGTRAALLRCIREHCCLPDRGEIRCILEYRGVDRTALQQVCELPERYVDSTHLLNASSSGSGLSVNDALQTVPAPFADVRASLEEARLG